MANTWGEWTLEDSSSRVMKLWSTTSPDGSNETNKVLIDNSALAGTPTSVSVDYLWIYSGDADVVMTFEFDATADDAIIQVSELNNGTFELDLRCSADGIVNGRSAGYTGDVTLTTTGFSSTKWMNIIIGGRKLYA